jgi:7,8-dihydropterin-6-yl-methyl-4-(beta-D-ribofuranosyl)aminobenzene 5'-phosphate synthase
MTQITLLMDNTALTDRYFLAEPGFSLYLEVDGKKILFDCGYSGAFLSNAEKMGIDLLDLDWIVLSHGHVDHTGGLVPLFSLLREARAGGRTHRVPTIVAHPSCFSLRTKGRSPPVGSPLTKDQVALCCPLHCTTHPLPLTPHCTFLGEIERVHPWEQAAPGERRIQAESGDWVPDQIMDDTGISCTTPEGLVVCTGCAHSGIGNTLLQAERVNRESRLRDVIGGWHLEGSDRHRIEETVRFLAARKPRTLHPCHCTSFAARVALSRALPVEEAGVGLQLKY